MSTIRFTISAATVASVAVALLTPAAASADTIAYLVNVTVRPGYHFGGPDDALRYGYSLCDDVAAGHPYGALIGTVKTDQQTTDDYQAAYLINQSVNELCPAQIWHLRQSAAGYRSSLGS